MPRAVDIALNSFGKIAYRVSSGKYTPGLTRESRRLAAQNLGRLEVRPDGLYKEGQHIGGNQYISSELLRSGIQTIDIQQLGLRDWRDLSRETKRLDDLWAKGSDKPNLYSGSFLPAILKRSRNYQEVLAWNSAINDGKQMMNERAFAIWQSNIIQTLEYFSPSQVEKGYLTRVAPAILERSSTPEDFWKWIRVTKDIPLHVQAEGFTNTIIPNILHKAQTPEAYSQWVKALSRLVEANRDGLFESSEPINKLNRFIQVVDQPDHLEGVIGLFSRLFGFSFYNRGNSSFFGSIFPSGLNWNRLLAIRQSES
jgi:hypothetical protein